MLALQGFPGLEVEFYFFSWALSNRFLASKYPDPSTKWNDGENIKPWHSIIGRHHIEFDRLLLGLPPYEILVAFCYTTDCFGSRYV